MNMDHLDPAVVVDVKTWIPHSGRVYSLTDTRRVLLIMMAYFLTDAGLYARAIITGQEVPDAPYAATLVILILSAVLMFTTWWAFRKSVLIQLDRKNRADVVAAFTGEIQEPDPPSKTSDIVH